MWLLLRKIATWAVRTSLSLGAWMCTESVVLELSPFQNLELRGGFIIAEAQLTAEPLLDPLERAASAQTIIRAQRFHIFLRADMDEQELSVSLYHEVLEAA